jgi:hypothetical protein
MMFDVNLVRLTSVYSVLPIIVAQLHVFFKEPMIFRTVIYVDKFVYGRIYNYKNTNDLLQVEILLQIY